MRRLDREITAPHLMDAFLKEALICRLALCDGSRPYIVPMIFAYHEECLFLHSAKEGKKMELLRRNNQVCFEVDENRGLLPAQSPCSWGLNYRSLIGYGEAVLVEDVQEKEEGLRRIMEKVDRGKHLPFSREALHAVVVIKVIIEEITGKECSLSLS